MKIKLCNLFFSKNIYNFKLINIYIYTQVCFVVGQWVIIFTLYSRALNAMICVMNFQTLFLLFLFRSFQVSFLEVFYVHSLSKRVQMTHTHSLVSCGVVCEVPAPRPAPARCPAGSCGAGWTSPELREAGNSPVWSWGVERVPRAASPNPASPL